MRTRRLASELTKKENSGGTAMYDKTLHRQVSEGIVQTVHGRERNREVACKG